MKKRETIISKLMELENNANHHFYFTGKSVTALETYGMRLIEEIEKHSQPTYKGIVKHFSVVMPYFDDVQAAEKFLSTFKESLSIAKDCYDEYAGFILIECDKEWAKHGINECSSRVFEYLKTLNRVRFVVLLPQTEKNRMDLYAAFSVVGVCAYIEVEEIDYKEYLEQINGMILDAGFSISNAIQEELCQVLEGRHDKTEDIELIISQWLSQLQLNRQFSGIFDKQIVIDDIRLLAGLTTAKGENRVIGFGAGR